MYITELEKRVTNHYAPGWSYLDSHHPICAMKVFPLRVVAEGNGYDDLGVRLQHIELADKSLRLRDVQQAIRDSFNLSTCQHEHDCCGCRSYHVRSIRRIGRGRFSFTMHITRNY